MNIDNIDAFVLKAFKIIMVPLIAAFSILSILMGIAVFVSPGVDILMGGYLLLSGIVLPILFWKIWSFLVGRKEVGDNHE